MVKTYTQNLSLSHYEWSGLIRLKFFTGCRGGEVVQELHNANEMLKDTEALIFVFRSTGFLKSLRHFDSKCVGDHLKHYILGRS